MWRHVWFLGVLACGSIVAAQQPRPPQVEWLYYGGDQAGTKFSPLADVNLENVHRLKIAWEWSH
jgi:glucose dehydrogenase